MDESTTETTTVAEDSTTETTTVAETTTEAPVEGDSDEEEEKEEEEFADTARDLDVKKPANDPTTNDTAQTFEERAAQARSDAMVNHAAEHGTAAGEESQTEEKVA